MPHEQQSVSVHHGLRIQVPDSENRLLSEATTLVLSLNRPERMRYMAATPIVTGALAVRISILVRA